MGSYYDIDTILMEEERIPCVFTEEAIGMGVLDPSSEGEDLPAGTKASCLCVLVQFRQTL
jgi:GINS complex subunit 3